MAHKMTIKVSPELVERTEDGVVDTEKVISDEAQAINDQFYADGKITAASFDDEVDGEDYPDGIYIQSITFKDSATCDEYLAAMAAIGEHERSGPSRSEFVREDVADAE
jgi:hypothetical protein